ncbi:eukaryotic translation initiation factor 5A [Artemisia annua]|uniref:Eukaryotic translation initiation factor 5A n=1 Tax=Artemisia annua TaxID=35608 RepID=A0A2U1KQ16_ARTAN|nr:eukaryotic translation initiation factor 5A [Artemisia annua]
MHLYPYFCALNELLDGFNRNEAVASVMPLRTTTFMDYQGINLRSQVERNWALGLQISLSVIRIHIEKHKYEHDHAKCHFVVIGIFNGNKVEDIVPSSYNRDFPHLNRTDYQLIDTAQDDLKFSTNDAMLKQGRDHGPDPSGRYPSIKKVLTKEQVDALSKELPSRATIPGVRRKEILLKRYLQMDELIRENSM